MDFKIKSGDLASQKTSCLILGVFEKHKLSGPAETVDKVSGGHLRDILRKGDLDGKTGRTLMLYGVPGVSCERVLLVGCGKRKDFDRRVYGRAIAAAVSLLNETRTTEALCSLPELIPEDMDLYRAVRDAVTVCADKIYRYDQTKADKKPPRFPLKRFHIWVSKKHDTQIVEKAAQHGAAIAEGVSLAKDLGNLPGNVCTPTYLADRALDLGKSYSGLRIEILEESDMQELGMGALLSVSRGSREPARLITLEYKGGNPGERPVALVGKGITFDSGGISIKPGAAMDEMKFDMCGAASVSAQSAPVSNWNCR